MKVLLAAATSFEIAALEAHLKQHYIQAAPHRYQRGEIQIALLITGVGLPMAAYALGKVVGADDWDLAINAGIGGSLDPAFPPGTVVQVVSERFADLGVEEADGKFTDVHELGLVQAGQPPFEQDGRMVNSGAAEFDFLPKAHGISVNRVHGYEPSIEALRQKYPDAQVESMEGAAFFYACALERVPYLQIRSISNWVEKRDRSRWQVAPALEQLNSTLIELVQSLFA
jgi:futalosine hydrolase